MLAHCEKIDAKPSRIPRKYEPETGVACLRAKKGPGVKRLLKQLMTRKSRWDAGKSSTSGRFVGRPASWARSHIRASR